HESFTIAIFERMQQLYPVIKGNPRSGPNAETVIVLLGHCRTEENVRIVVRDAEGWGVFEHPRVQEEVLRTCLRVCAAGNGKKAANPSYVLSRVLDWANRYAARGVSLSPEAVNIILQAFGKAGAVLEGLSFVDRIHQNGKVTTSKAMPLLELLRAVERRTERRGAGDERVAQRAWEEVTKGSSDAIGTPPPKTVATIIDALGKLVDVRGVWRLYRSMTRDGKPLDPIIARSFVRAFGSRLATDPRAAAAVFSAALTGKPGSGNDKIVLDLLGGIRDRKEAVKTLDTLLALLVARNMPIESNTLVKAFARIVDEARDKDLPPMAFSTGTELQKLGAWSESATPSKLLVDATRIAVVKATAKGVAGAAQEVREGTDVEGALSSLEQLLGNGNSKVDKDGGVADALQRLEGWLQDDQKQP
ncbi:hypothetical protein HK097_004297, partial [Rhizophlyctis rosea]